MTTYARSRGRRSYPPRVGRVAKPNRRPGACRVCQEEIPAYGGQLYREPGGAWSVVHHEATQGGWLMDPRPVTGGCPESTDRRNAELYARGFFGPGADAPSSERDRIAARAKYQSELAERDARTDPGKYAYTSTGARMTDRARRCEDAPCCGCCD